MEIRGKTISYSSYLKNENAKEEKKLIEEIETENSENLDFDTINSKRKELESLRRKRMEGVY